MDTQENSWLQNKAELRKSSNKIRHERLLRGWSQAKLAELLDFDVRSIRRWEQGVTTPTSTGIQRLVEVFKKNAEELGLVEENRKATYPWQDNNTLEAATEKFDIARRLYDDDPELYKELMMQRYAEANELNGEATKPTEEGKQPDAIEPVCKAYTRGCQARILMLIQVDSEFGKAVEEKKFEAMESTREEILRLLTEASLMAAYSYNLRQKNRQYKTVDDVCMTWHAVAHKSALPEMIELYGEALRSGLSSQPIHSCQYCYLPNSLGHGGYLHMEEMGCLGRNLRLETTELFGNDLSPQLFRRVIKDRIIRLVALVDLSGLPKDWPTGAEPALDHSSFNAERVDAGQARETVVRNRQRDQEKRTDKDQLKNEALLEAESQAAADKPSTGTEKPTMGSHSWSAASSKNLPSFEGKARTISVETQEWKMRSFLVVVVSLMFIVSLVVGIVVFFLAKTGEAFILPASTLPIMYHLVRYFFPHQREKHSKEFEAIKRQQSP